MTNLASTLKQEIARIARKEARAVVEPMRKQVAAQRRDLAAVKRERDELKRTLSRIGRDARRPAPRAEAIEEPTTTIRYSADGLAKLRKRLALSQGAFGLLAGVSAQSVYNWERGATRPRPPQLVRIAEIRAMGKREAAQALVAAEADA